MKGGKAALAVFVPTKGGAEDGAEEEAEEEGAESKGTIDSLLGNAFDAHTEGDREGFIRSMRAAIKTSK